MYTSPYEKNLLTITSKEPIRLSGYALKSAYDCDPRDPCKWKFYAINDAGEQILIHETPDDDNSRWGYDRSTFKEFQVNYGENEFFSHKFVLDILSLNGSSTTQLG